MTFELGVYSFGNTQPDDQTAASPTAAAVRNVLEGVRLADSVGLDFFGFGEHHTRSSPLSSPTSLVTAAAAMTERITVGTAVTVLSTDDPIRVFEQLATADAIAPGRVEAVAGRGSSTITFDLFDHDESEYDPLFASKLELLRAVNNEENVSFSGHHRRKPLRNTTAFPRPASPLPLWLGSGGSVGSVGRAVELGMPLFLGVLGGSPEHWGNYAHAYRQAWGQAGHAPEDARVAIAMHGFVGEDDAEAKRVYLQHEARMFEIGAAEAGRPPMQITGREADVTTGMVFVGDPETVAQRIIALHQLMGHQRHIIQMDVGGLPHRDYLRAIELLGTEVLPRVRAAIDS